MTGRNADSKTTRRTVLKAALLGSVGTLGFSKGASAATTEKITVVQGDHEYTVEPLSFQNQTVSEFYGYSNVQSNTPTDIERSDVSELFFYRGPKGLSLCIIHDRPNDRSGGAVTFNFTGLPIRDGSWVVLDDSGDMNGETDTSPDWSWANSKTDGGVFRGGLEGVDMLRIDPAFNEAAVKAPLDPGRISEWQLLGGDPSNPERTTLNMDQPITISVGTSPSPTPLETAANQKLALADHVTALAQNIDDKALASTAVSRITTGYENDTLTQTQALDAIERLQLGENVTETALGGLGPRSLPSPEDRETLVGAPSGTPAARDEVSILEQTVEHVLFLGTSIFAGLAALRLAKNVWGSGGLLAKAASGLSNGIDTVFSLLPVAAGYLKSESESAGDKLVDVVREENLEDGEKIFNLLSNILTEKIERGATVLQGGVETVFCAREKTMDEKVREFHRTVGSGDETTASGSQSAVREAAAAATENVQSKLDEVDNELDVTKYAAIAADILGLVGGVIAAVSAVTGVGALVGGVLAGGGILASISFNFLGTVAGIDGTANVVYQHNDGLTSMMNAGGQ